MKTYIMVNCVINIKEITIIPLFKIHFLSPHQKRENTISPNILFSAPLPTDF
jgi:hypothetical protein